MREYAMNMKNKIKAIFLGTNGWYDSNTGNTICTLLVTDKYNIILDAGNGIYKADQYINKKNPVHLFLSHFHIDHIEGLHILAKFRFKELVIYGQPGTREILNEFIGDKYSIPLKKLLFPAKVVELKEVWNRLPYRVQALPLVHASKCYGYRIEIDDKIISYCTDTGYCKNSVILSKGADLLISECALLPGKQTKQWPHMNPELAAKLAKNSGAKKLVLTHFDANEYRSIGQRMRALKKAKSIFTTTIVAKDGLTTDIT